MSDNAISTIEVKARKLVRPEGGEASGSQEQIINDDNEASGSATGSHGQLIEQSEMLSIVIDDKSKTSRSFQERLNSLKREAQKSNLTPKIQKVPFILRENKDFEKYYEPRVVAVGPIHHGHPKFEYAENAKRRLAGAFIEENGIDAESLYNKIMAELQDLKNSYVEDVIKSYSDDELAWMFLVDGSAILHFIYCVVHEIRKLEELQIKKDQVAFAQQDLFLLENQLPFQLLQLLMTFILDNKKKETINNSIRDFIHSNKMTTDRPMETLPKNAYHLLDLLRKQLLICTQTAKECQTPHSFRNVTELIASDLYAEVQDAIEKHYNSKYISWMAQAYHSYFSSPWTFLALLGALFALFLSSVQAYYSWRPRN
ncbi:UPF0481 protein At3g47200 isoform X2 [Jatropha curcas]|uniref:UPF0481 protein At3g47200 isoform X2 n=1 Tax=Jatropha curcas TaxID=180498 RepID=UPI001893278C|nr:UPF0481 protein At3g47200 isoform X2 [Jatropha curcas]